jgi:O-antigen/teichoic acid export membrane protein
VTPRSDVRRVAAASAWGIAGRAAVLGLGLVSVALSTRYLGATEYGRLALALSITQLFSVVADAGLTTTAVRELAQRPERAPVVVGSVLVLRSVLAVGAVVAAALLALALPYPSQVRVAVLVAGVPLALGLLNSGWLAVLQADLRAARIAVADVLGRAAALGALVVVVVADLGFYAVIGAAGVGAAVTLGLTSWLARPLLAERPHAERATERRLLRAALPLGLALVLNEAYFRADALIISLSRPFAELGRYALAWRVSELAATGAAAFLVAAFPVLARYAGSGDPRFGPALQAAGDVAMAIGAPLAFGGAVVADRLALALGGDEFAGAAEPMRLLLFAVALGFVGGVLGNALIAAGRQAATLWLNVVALVLNVAFCAALVPSQGIMAAAWTALGCEAVILVAGRWLVGRHLGVAYSGAFAARCLPAAAVMAGVLWPLRDDGLWLTIPLGAVVYAGTLWALGGLRRSRLSALREP